jgi:tRNA threonylcarbamoyladenosine biosynthesis protein TsaE
VSGPLVTLGNEPVALETPGDVRAWGAALAKDLRAGDLVVLTGPLGAGKTVLVQGIAAGLGVRTPITSPTFVIARVHRDGRVPLVHVDAYRLGSLAEVDDLDLDVDVADSVTVVEWGAGLVERLATSHLEVKIARDDLSEVRTIKVIGHGDRWKLPRAVVS